VWDVQNNRITELEISARDFGFTPFSLELVRGGEPAHNAQVFRSLLDNTLPVDDPVHLFVTMNAAALLYICGKADSLKAGVAICRESIASGHALEVFEKFRNKTELL
jgi:anthranilate phosphoribosyltransferase